jgi:3-isopropylmalate/(R)-2-methylmalate dehydratase large subunit
MAVVFASGKLWFRVPETFLVMVEGKLPEGVYAKDIVLTVIGKVTASGANYMAVEYAGNTVRDLSVEARMTLCNMAVEMGGKTGIVAPDSKTIQYVGERMAKNQYQVFFSDSDADYIKRLEIDATDLVPVVACPHEVDNVKPVSEVEGTSVDQVYIGTCTNGRIEDLRIAAKVLKNQKTKPITIITPASREVYLQALKEGLIEIFVKAGAVVCNPGCGPCVGTHQGIPSPGYTVVSTANRNFKGRMGSDEAEIYLASPHTAAVTAVRGKITDPRSYP